MPRRHRSARERPPPASPRPSPDVAPAWAQAEGVAVRQMSGERPYRCPGCQQVIRPGVVHLVVVPDAGVDLRRHWHEACWRTELRRRR
jgi:hypothetical protein